MDVQGKYARRQMDGMTFTTAVRELYPDRYNELMDEWEMCNQDELWFGDFLHNHYKDIFAHCVAYMKATGKW